MGPSETGATAPPRRRRLWLWVLAAVPVAIAALAIAGFFYWALTPHQPNPTALAALRSDDKVSVSQVAGGWIFVPAAGSSEATAGLILYPGARVDSRAYATYARALAEQGYAVAVADMPLHLAILKPNAADRLLAQPQIASVKRWAIGGHSIGGVAAARYAAEHPELIDGLVLLASYPQEQVDLSASPIIATSVTGTLDGVLNWQDWDAAKPRLPSDTTFVSIEGGNHAQFGDYAGQALDGKATVSREEQRDRTVLATMGVLSRLGAQRP